MRKYKTLLFDVDDTLLDFAAAERASLSMLLESQGVLYDAENHKIYSQINKRLWKSFEEGLISSDELFNTRFTLLFKELGKSVDGPELEKHYRRGLGEGHYLMSGALEVITELKDHFALYIVTNGISQTQDRRLKLSGLFPAFKAVFVSEDTGFQKPMKGFFDFVFERIPNCELSETLIIGDSLTADIKGGILAGIDTCWVNPNGIKNTTEWKPTYEVKSLDELYNVLEVTRKTESV